MAEFEPTILPRQQTAVNLNQSSLSDNPSKKLGLAVTDSLQLRANLGS
eukprot:CAMPEP_0170184666 /NCGR_PEP_ID=MMETSP0040_2-20121228/34302_1 /TAXON_ID=641309 /ORGANISM="Lotharella oceanica, Strain CCMP622" /LENGTH=47 /DNA_ID= /DNA_START= /DNA_END= /DNA_ORIENTATION=